MGQSQSQGPLMEVQKELEVCESCSIKDPQFNKIKEVSRNARYAQDLLFICFGMWRGFHHIREHAFVAHVASCVKFVNAASFNFTILKLSQCFIRFVHPSKCLSYEAAT
ncbi:uncharacterized protein LOC104906591 isoform X1 [Beta vulgaris subsp. vulgaris]|uniref:uncharacterized protein LOC104906591 isoform X1 n=1 Tax=Beta vulgaris subsp. vulgaris TaxID=3555 RepID=UPI00053F4398|nr:uncharacterized protein LOC104906591 isoform X1 [Beta vulgaris subsp. vulgaris]